MSETEKCPTCGTPVRVMGGMLTNYYEPLGLDALERDVVEAALRWAQYSTVRRKAQHARMGELELLLYEYSHDLLAARAANVGKEAGE